MESLIYLSTVDLLMTEYDIQRLANKAAVFNESIGITGFLSFRKNQFIQYLEGSEEELQLLMAKIRQDERHSISYEMYFGTRKSRLFPNWEMKYLSLYEATPIDLECLIDIYCSPTNILSFGEEWAKQKVNQVLLKIKELKHPATKQTQISPPFNNE